VRTVTRIVLIRLGGLAAMVGGLAATTLGLAVWLPEPASSRSIPYLDSASNPAIQTLVNVSDVLLMAGALAAIAALHSLHGGCNGMMGTLVSLVAFVGVALLLVLALGDVLRWHPWFSTSPLRGFTLAALGGMGLGVATMVRRVLPWWCGLALIVGSPGLAFAGLLGDLSQRWREWLGRWWAMPYSEQSCIEPSSPRGCGERTQRQKLGHSGVALSRRLAVGVRTSTPNQIVNEFSVPKPDTVRNSCLSPT
jgi:hypothetical protein